MSLRVALSEKFPEAPESEILKVNGEYVGTLILIQANKRKKENSVGMSASLGYNCKNLQ